MRCGWGRTLVPGHCCSFPCAAPFSLLRSFHRSCSAVHCPLDLFLLSGLFACAWGAALPQRFSCPSTIFGSLFPCFGVFAVLALSPVSQSGSGWEEPQWLIRSNFPAQEGSSQSRATGLCLGGSWISPARETPQLRWAVCASARWSALVSVSCVLLFVLSMFTAYFCVCVFAEVLCALLILFWHAMGQFCHLLNWLDQQWSAQSHPWPPSTQVTTAAPSLPKPCWLWWLQLSGIKNYIAAFLGWECKRQHCYR